MKIVTDDTVLIIQGKDRGKQGKVILNESSNMGTADFFLAFNDEGDAAGEAAVMRVAQGFYSS